MAVASLADDTEYSKYNFFLFFQNKSVISCQLLFLNRSQAVTRMVSGSLNIQLSRSLEALVGVPLGPQALRWGRWEERGRACGGASE